MKQTFYFFILLTLIFIGSKINAQTISTYGSNFTTPFGLEFDDLGNLWVAQVGSGNDDGIISVIEPNGTTHDIITGFPSDASPDGNVSGARRVYPLPNNRLMVVIGAGDHPLSAHLLTYDLSGFTLGDPAKSLDDYDEAIDIGTFVINSGLAESDPSSVVLNSAGDLLISDAAASAILKRDGTTGTLSILKEFEEISIFTFSGPQILPLFPTRIISDGGNGYYVSLQTVLDFAGGQGSIKHVAADGTTTDYVGGFNLSLVSDIATNPINGLISTLDFGTFNEDSESFEDGSALLYQITLDTFLANLVTKIGPAAGLAFDAAGNAYVSTFFSGEILKIESSAPVNDNLCNATAINVGDNCNGIPNINNWNATAETDEPPFTCPTSNPVDTEVRNSVWFSFVAPEGPIYILANPEIPQSSFAYQMNLFSLDGDCTDLTNLNNLACNAPIVNVQDGTLIFTTLTTGETYYLQISGRNFGNPSDVLFSAAGCVIIETIETPTNDDACDAVELIVGDAPQFFSNLGATGQAGEMAINPPSSAPSDFLNFQEGWAMFSQLDKSVWFTFTTPPEGGDFTINLFNSVGVPGNFNVQAAVYEATDCEDFTTYTYVNSGDNGIPPPPPGSFSSAVSLSPSVNVLCEEGNKTYMVVVDGGNSFFFNPVNDEGFFSISIDQLESPSAPTIDIAYSPAVCVDDGIDENINVEVINAGTGVNQQWVITDENLNILDLPFGPPFNFEGTGEGVCLIWLLKYSEVDGLEIGLNGGDLTGCFALSDPIAVERYEGGDCDEFVRPDLEMEVYADQLLYDQFEHVLFTFVVTNHGSKPATGVKVSAAIPNGMVYGEGHFASQGEYNLFFETWDVGTLEPGQSEYLDVEMFTMVSGQDITVSSQVIEANEPDIDSSPNNNAGEDDEAFRTISPATNGGFRTEDGDADLSLNLEFGFSDFKNYEVTPFTVTVTNNGPDDATEIIVNIPKPANTVFSGTGEPADISQGEWNSWFEKWSIDHLPSGESATLTLEVFTLGGQAPLSAYAQVFITNELDPDSTPGNGDGQNANEDDEAVANISINNLFNGNGNIQNLIGDMPNATNSFQLQPNPATDKITISHSSSEGQLGSYRILNMEGKVLKYFPVEMFKGQNQLEMNISDLPEGVYLVEVMGEQGFMENLRFVKMK